MTNRKQTLVGFAKNPKPFAPLVTETYIGEITNLQPLSECLPRVRLTDRLRPKPKKRK